MIVDQVVISGEPDFHRISWLLLHVSEMAVKGPRRHSRALRV